MPATRPHSPWALLAGAVIVVGITIVGFVLSLRHLESLRIMARAPRATLAAPVSGPAIYRGVLTPDVPQLSPTGVGVTYFWWWGTSGRRNNNTVCYGSDGGTLNLVDQGVSLPMRLDLSSTNISLLADDREWDFDFSQPTVVDLGSLPELNPGIRPPVLNRCPAFASRYSERALPPGTVVEVLASYRDGALQSCPGVLPGVVSVQSLRNHQARRARAAMSQLLTAASINALLLFLLGFRYVALKARVLAGDQLRRRQS